MNTSIQHSHAMPQNEERRRCEARSNEIKERTFLFKVDYTEHCSLGLRNVVRVEEVDNQKETGERKKI